VIEEDAVQPSTDGVQSNVVHCMRVRNNVLQNNSEMNDDVASGPAGDTVLPEPTGRHGRLTSISLCVNVNLLLGITEVQSDTMLHCKHRLLENRGNGSLWISQGHTHDRQDRINIL
jgi:hypothetical protein